MFKNGILILSLLTLSALSLVNPVFAGDYTIDGAQGNLDSIVNSDTGIEHRDLSSYLVVLIKGLLAATGFVFFILTLYGGFLWMTARGEETKVEQGRDTVIQATIGLAIIVAAYAITVVIVGKVVG